MTRLYVYVAAVTALGLAVGAAVFTGLVPGPGIVVSGPVVILTLAAVVTQFYPIAVMRGRGNEDFEPSHAFVLAVLLIAGPATTVVVQMIAIVAISAVRRRPLIKNIFNVAQMTVAMGAAGIVLAALGAVPAMGDGTGLSLAETGAYLLASLSYQVINEVAVSSVCALAEQRPVLRFLTGKFRMTALTAAASATGPVAAAAALTALWLVPMLMAPLWAYRRSTALALASFEQARRDGLTGLPNALALREVLDEAAGHRAMAIAMLDLDGFKDINDSLGHQAGDDLLREVAARLTEESAGRGRVFRLQGDEFVTLLDGPEPADALAYADGLMRAFQEPFLAAGQEVEIGVSAGVAAIACGECATDELLRRADVAMYDAKRNRLGAALYTPEAEGGERARQIISADLRRALAAGEIEVHYQPQISLRTGRILSVEALVRWRRADGTRVPPVEFIPQAERTGVILPLTLHVLRTAVADCRRWRDELGYEGRVGINLSARTLHHASLVADVRAALDDAELEPGRLELEITESALMADPDRARRTLAALHDLGVDILIDDFGTGYSSLAYLGTLPVDGVKIDRSFIAGMAHSRTDAVIVRATLDLGHNLGLRVIAEGVEDVETRDRLAAIECDIGQGWLWNPALPADELAALLADPEAPALAA